MSFFVRFLCGNYQDVIHWTSVKLNPEKYELWSKFRSHWHWSCCVEFAYFRLSLKIMDPINIGTESFINFSFAATKWWNNSISPTKCKEKIFSEPWRFCTCWPTHLTSKFELQNQYHKFSVVWKLKHKPKVIEITTSINYVFNKRIKFNQFHQSDLKKRRFRCKTSKLSKVVYVIWQLDAYKHKSTRIKLTQSVAVRDCPCFFRVQKKITANSTIFCSLTNTFNRSHFNNIFN